jgi:hypothetical protein
VGDAAAAQVGGPVELVGPRGLTKDPVDVHDRPRRRARGGGMPGHREQAGTVCGTPASQRDLGGPPEARGPWTGEERGAAPDAVAGVKRVACALDGVEPRRAGEQPHREGQRREQAAERHTSDRRECQES